VTPRRWCTAKALQRRTETVTAAAFKEPCKPICYSVETMRISSVLFAAFFFLACAHTPAPAPASTVSGWVSDAACGVSHVGGKNPGCVLKCMKGGAHIGHPEWKAQAMVLVVDGTERLLVVANPEALFGREAQHVTLEARVEDDTLHVIRVVN
jgi:hypothetical protein